MISPQLIRGFCCDKKTGFYWTRADLWQKPISTMAKKRTRSQRRNRRRREARRDEKRRDPTRRVEACIDETCVVCLEHADAYPTSHDCPQCAKRVCAPCVLKMLQLRSSDGRTIIGFPCAVCRNWIDLADKQSLACAATALHHTQLPSSCSQRSPRVRSNNIVASEIEAPNVLANLL